jgi:hypothetical protein
MTGHSETGKTIEAADTPHIRFILETDQITRHV